MKQKPRVFHYYTPPTPHRSSRQAVQTGTTAFAAGGAAKQLQGGCHIMSEACPAEYPKEYGLPPPKELEPIRQAAALPPGSAGAQPGQVTTPHAGHTGDTRPTFSFSGGSSHCSGPCCGGANSEQPPSLSFTAGQRPPRRRRHFKSLFATTASLGDEISESVPKVRLKLKSPADSSVVMPRARSRP